MLSVVWAPPSAWSSARLAARYFSGDVVCSRLQNSISVIDGIAKPARYRRLRRGIRIVYALFTSLLALFFRSALFRRIGNTASLPKAGRPHPDKDHTRWLACRAGLLFDRSFIVPLPWYYRCPASVISHDGRVRTINIAVRCFNPLAALSRAPMNPREALGNFWQGLTVRDHCVLGSTAGGVVLRGVVKGLIANRN